MHATIDLTLTLLAVRQTQQTQRGQSLAATPSRADTLASPLKPDELQVLRSQYEKEGEYVGVQTKFNYAWVRGLMSTVDRQLKTCVRA